MTTRVEERAPFPRMRHSRIETNSVLDLIYALWKHSGLVPSNKRSNQAFLNFVSPTVFTAKWAIFRWKVVSKSQRVCERSTLRYSGEKVGVTHRMSETHSISDGNFAPQSHFFHWGNPDMLQAGIVCGRHPWQTSRRLASLVPPPADRIAAPSRMYATPMATTPTSTIPTHQKVWKRSEWGLGWHGSLVSSCCTGCALKLLLNMHIVSNKL